MSTITITPYTKCSTLVRAPTLRGASPAPGSAAFEKKLTKRLRAAAPADDSFKSRLVYKATSWIDRVRGLPKRVIELPAAPPPSRAASCTVPLIFVTSEEESGAEFKPVARQQRVKTVRPKDGTLVVPRVRYTWQWNPEADVLSDLPQKLAQPDLAYLDDSLDSIPEEADQVVDVRQRLSDMDALVEMLRAEIAAEGRADEDSCDYSDETVRMGVPGLVFDKNDSPVLENTSMPVTPVLRFTPATPTIDDGEFKTAEEFELDLSAEQDEILKFLGGMWSGAARGLLGWLRL
ncbi:hypothetical protein EVG20_g7705 [Dentipellis fragilis]|uniref:Uncharacterized protein n=1 Tax=Dentipellis fragilis TaxID=205917 RepID=A0A4Y9YAX9_9AGAM|nr:hypothetical protein EVG20_g7705 [Dentipellis fragilis]